MTPRERADIEQGKGGGSCGKLMKQGAQSKGFAQN